MNPIETLTREHDLIVAALDVLERMAGAIRAGSPLPAERHSEVVRFFREFADRHHHEKEEELLFPALESVGFPRDSGPVAVMLHEHDVGRGLVGRMAAALEAGFGEEERARFASAAFDFVALLRNHIHKENRILFRMASETLPASRLEALRVRFRAHALENDGVAERAALTVEGLERALHHATTEGDPRRA